MNEELKTELGINEWLELIKEDKNLNGAYISIYQYIYLIEKELQELKKKLEESKKFNNKVLIYNASIKYNSKKFIKYLEDEIKRINPKELDIGELNLRLDDIKFTQYLIYKETLQKYKKLIGDVKDENNDL